VPAPADVLADNLRFLRALVTRPKNIGAIVPSSRALARAIAQQIDPGRPGPVLELGPGTGVITEALLERGLAGERLTLVEYDPEMAASLARRFDRAQVIEGDAFDLGRTLGAKAEPNFIGIVSGLPLLNFPFPRRHSLIETVCRLLSPGAPFVQFSYGVNAPVAPPSGFGVSRAALIWANLPPARVWVYRKN
jgi:phosphatidylethanolamine/phosphatidyl-N-methylethanolamine N-methyltransferase